MFLGHIQYLSTIIKDDRRYFRKKYGVQFLLDVNRTYYNVSAVEESGISKEDAHTIRCALLNLAKYFLQRDVNMKEITALLR